MAVPVYNEQFHKFTGGYSRTSTQGVANTKYIISHLMNDYGWSFNACAGILGNIENESALNPNRPQTSSQDYFPNNSAGQFGGNYGFGLVQWTPWYRAYNDEWTSGNRTPQNGDGLGHPTYYQWCIDNGIGTPTRTESNPIGRMEPQLKYLTNVPWGYYTYSRFGYSWPWPWNTFIHTTESPEEVAGAWLWNYERPNSVSGRDTTKERAEATLHARQADARWYYDTYFAEFGSGQPGPGPGPGPEPPGPSKYNFLYGGKRKWPILFRRPT